MNIIEKIKLLLLLKKSEKEIETMALKSGIKTSEFWLTVLTQIGVVVTGLSGIIDPKIATILSVASGALYTVLRTLAKSPEITTLVDNSTTVNNPPVK